MNKYDDVNHELKTWIFLSAVHIVCAIQHPSAILILQYIIHANVKATFMLLQYVHSSTMILQHLPCVMNVFDWTPEYSENCSV